MYIAVCYGTGMLSNLGPHWCKWTAYLEFVPQEMCLCHWRHSLLQHWHSTCQNHETYGLLSSYKSSCVPRLDCKYPQVAGDTVLKHTNEKIQEGWLRKENNHYGKINSDSHMVFLKSWILFQVAGPENFLKFPPVSVKTCRGQGRYHKIKIRGPLGKRLCQFLLPVFVQWND